MYSQIFIIDIQIKVLHRVCCCTECLLVQAKQWLWCLLPFTSKAFFPLKNSNDPLLSCILYYSAPCRNYIIPWLAFFFNTVSCGSHESVTKTGWRSLHTVNIFMLYLQMNKLFISDGAVKPPCSYCLLLYYISLSGSTVLRLQNDNLQQLTALHDLSYDRAEFHAVVSLL